MNWTRHARLSGGPRLARLSIADVLVLLAAVSAVTLMVADHSWSTRRAFQREWLPQGPACPVAATPSIATRGAKPPPPFVFQGVGFAYQIGDAFCTAAPVETVFSKATFPVCNFDAPAAIEVTTDGRKVLFEPGVGHSATVAVRDGRASCVIGAGLHG